MTDEERIAALQASTEGRSLPVNRDHLRWLLGEYRRLKAEIEERKDREEWNYDSHLEIE